MNNLLRGIYRFAFAGDTLRALAEAAGFALLGYAGWLFDPMAAALVASAYFLNLAYSPRSKK